MLKKDELSELKGQFLASLNHEIRTPLSGILGMIDLLLETPLSTDQRDYAGATRVCAENLLEILNVTLEYSALSAGHIRIEETEFSLRQALEGVIAEFSLKAGTKGLRLIGNFDRSLPSAVVGDALRLRQMLWHLVGNAIKFTDQGEVEVRASAGTQEGSVVAITIAIRDTGIGIAPQKLASVFESFEQSDAGLARSHSGLGLGLAVAHKLATLLNSSITVESELGRGSTFLVRVPLRLPADVAVRAADLTRARHRVLVVDDNPVGRTIASHALRRSDYDVECVVDGLAAVEAASNASFDLILLDLQMPGLDGFQTAERIRRLPAYAQTPIVAVTANCSSEFQDRCRNQGMQGFLAKPFGTKELVQIVEKYLGQATLQ